MAKLVKLEPISKEAAVQTNDNLLSALLTNELDVLRECGGRGLCATCHVYVKGGEDSLSPMSRREQRTLEVITSCRPNSRLACQAQVWDDGIVVEVPGGMYVSEIIGDIESLIGRRAEDNILHPLTGKVLIPKGKLIIRTLISQLQITQNQVKDVMERSQDI
ncbi:MAG: 2Fe-2S iron-sulfur cluster-binding protein [Cyanobacteria bacterium P01_H01_bin.15]